MTPTVHRVRAISFRLGSVDCTCGATLTAVAEVVTVRGTRCRAGTPEALAGAFSGHRSAAGLSSRSATLAYDHRAHPSPDDVRTA